MSLPTHIRCPYCEHEEKLPLYVYAHWTDTFLVECDACHKKFAMFQGETEAIEEEK